LEERKKEKLPEQFFNKISVKKKSLNKIPSFLISPLPTVLFLGY